MPPSRESMQNRGDEDEVCPVCKSSRYLNPDMQFLINPECYHKMCESCVDRIFSSGPANCPVATCHKTLRKNRFRKQTFEDINVEREVDIRRRVMQMYVDIHHSENGRKAKYLTVTVSTVAKRNLTRSEPGMIFSNNARRSLRTLSMAPT